MSEKPQVLEELIKNIESQNYITIEQFNQLKKYSLLPGGFSSNDEKSNKNQIIIINALLNMQEDKNVQFFTDKKKHPCKKISQIFKDEIENKNSESEITVVNKDIDRCIFNQWKKNNKEIDYELKEFQKQIEDYLKENKTKYSYYQGYLDFCVFFYNLFYDKNKPNKISPYINSIKLFTELYLKDYISPFKSIGKKDDIIFQNSISLMTDIIYILDKNIYELLKEESGPLCLCLSWVITLFTHEINDFYAIRRILDYLLLNEPINVYILSAIIIVKSIQKNVKNVEEAECEDIFIGIKNIDLNNIDFNYMIVECDKFIKNNIEDILAVQEKNENVLFLIGDYNFRGIENIIYSYNKENLPIRYIKTNNSFIVSYRFIFILFLLWIFVIYFFQKDNIMEGLNRGDKLDNNIDKKYINNKTKINDEDEEF